MTGPMGRSRGGDVLADRQPRDVSQGERAGARAAVEVPGASHALPASEPEAVAVILRAAAALPLLRDARSVQIVRSPQ
jgi:hypothetical protein